MIPTKALDNIDLKPGDIEPLPLPMQVYLVDGETCRYLVAASYDWTVTYCSCPYSRYNPDKICKHREWVMTSLVAV